MTIEFVYFSNYESSGTLLQRLVFCKEVRQALALAVFLEEFVVVWNEHWTDYCLHRILYYRLTVL